MPRTRGVEGRLGESSIKWEEEVGRVRVRPTR